MIQRISHDHLRAGLRITAQLWPLWLCWPAWSFASDRWESYLVSLPDRTSTSYIILYDLWPTAALLGPFGLMAAALLAYRGRIAGRTTVLAGIAGMAIGTLLTVWPEAQRLWPDMGQAEYSLNDLVSQIDRGTAFATFVGLMAVLAGLTTVLQATKLGARSSGPVLLRGQSDNFGHADWLSIDNARKHFPGPDPAYGGIVVGEAYRVDQDRAVAGVAFDPTRADTWGRGGTAPLLVDPCRTGPTHGLVFAGSGGFKTTAVGIPTLLTWTGSAVILDPSGEIGPMVMGYRRTQLGHRIVMLDPATAATTGINVLDWIDITSPLAETQVEAVVRWLSVESRGQASAGSTFFSDTAQGLIACLLADLLWDPELTSGEKTLRALRRRLITPEDQMRALLDDVHQRSASRLARDLAGTLKGLVAETFSGVYANANRETRWLSTPAFGDLVSGGAEGRDPACHTADLAGGKLTVFLQIPLHVLQSTPAVGRVLVGALLNAVYEADGRVQGRVLFLLDEVARLGFMQVLEQARDAGRKYGITLLLLYQSLGQLIDQWGPGGKQAWYDSTSWRMFAAVQDPMTAKELSEICGEYSVVATSYGDSEGSQARAGRASSTSGRSENRSEIKRALIKPEELIQDTRSDEAFVLIRGARPLRCGRAIWFRRPEWKGVVGENRFHRGFK